MEHVFFLHTSDHFRPKHEPTSIITRIWFANDPPIIFYNIFLQNVQHFTFSTQRPGIPVSLPSGHTAMSSLMPKTPPLNCKASGKSVALPDKPRRGTRRGGGVKKNTGIWIGRCWSVLCNDWAVYGRKWLGCLIRDFSQKLFILPIPRFNKKSRQSQGTVDYMPAISYITWVAP